MKNIFQFLILLSTVAAGAVDYKTEIAPVFEQRCVWCHSVGGHQAGGLYLETDHAEDNMISIPSTQKNGAIRVVPGDIEASYLIKKLRGDLDIVGARMPPGFYPPIEPEIMEKIQTWILELPKD